MLNTKQTLTEFLMIIQASDSCSPGSHSGSRVHQTVEKSLKETNFSAAGPNMRSSVGALKEEKSGLLESSPPSRCEVCPQFILSYN